MRTLGTILRKFFGTNKEQYWLCIPKSMNTKRNKDLFIMDTIEFLTNKIQIDEK